MRPLVVSLSALVMAVVLVVACSVNPATGKRQLMLVSTPEEIALGQQADGEIAASLGLYEDDEVQLYVAQIGDLMATLSERPDLPWTFRVVDDPVVNAFALPGGFVYITRGIMAHFNSEAELVAVMAHEIGHVTARHSASQMSKQQLATLGLSVGMVVEPSLAAFGDLAQMGMGLLFLRFSRDDERQADDLGLRYVVRNGYDPHALTEVFEVLARVSEEGEGERLPGWLSTHPDPEDRVERTTYHITLLGEEQQQGKVGRDIYLARIDGMVFGQDPREGFFKHSAFYHPEMQFQIEFPEDWKTSNQKSAVWAISPNDDAVIQLSLSRRFSPQEAADAFLSQEGVTGGRVWLRSVNDLPALGFPFAAETSQGELHGLMLYVAYQTRVYQLVGYTSAERWDRHNATLAASLSSFAPLTDRRYLEVQPQRIKLVQVSESMTLEEFHRRYPSTVSLEKVALLNHMEVTDRVGAGRKVKRIVGGQVP
jgi:predicted Zn-dependent protease